MLAKLRCASGIVSRSCLVTTLSGNALAVLIGRVVIDEAAETFNCSYEAAG